MQNKDSRCTKFMPRFDGPYKILEAYPESSSYRLKLPLLSQAYPSFHSSNHHLFVENDDELFSGQKLSPPSMIITTDGSTEYFIEHILDAWPQPRGQQYLVCWQGYGPKHDLWLPQSELLETEVLESWEAQER